MQSCQKSILGASFLATATRMVSCCRLTDVVGEDTDFVNVQLCWNFFGRSDAAASLIVYFLEAYL